MIKDIVLTTAEMEVKVVKDAGLIPPDFSSEKFELIGKVERKENYKNFTVACDGGNEHFWMSESNLLAMAKAQGGEAYKVKKAKGKPDKHVFNFNKLILTCTKGQILAAA